MTKRHRHDIMHTHPQQDLTSSSHKVVPQTVMLSTWLTSGCRTGGQEFPATVAFGWMFSWAT